MSLFAKIDAEGFLAGFISDVVVDPLNLDNVIFEPVPDMPLVGMAKWRWQDGAWVARTNVRGHVWYNPEEPDQVHRPTAWDDLPPVGWSYWTPGENPVISEAAQLRRARAKKLDEMQAAGKAAAISGFTAGGFPWASTLEAQQAIQLTWQDMQEADGPTSVQYPDANGVERTLTKIQFKGLGRALRTHLETQRTKLATRKAQIAAATTVAEIEAISW
jgi:hypothetical protein